MKQFYETYKDADEKLSPVVRQISWTNNLTIMSRSKSAEDLLEHRTDGTDAFDTLFIGCEKFPQSDYSGGIVDAGGGECNRFYISILI